ncbi:hypothetical protein KEJ27_10515 [Candidatus Bathyarchaeota archaeon]|nr:hypothetical protein [Candidatus Bathyarchaeota archaeon]
MVEEYVVGAIGDVIHAYMIKQIPRVLANLLLRIYAKLISRSSLVVFLDADYCILSKRWKMRGTPHETMEYVSSLRVSARLLKEMGYNVRFVNTETDTVLMHDKILSLLLSHIRIHQQC